jgi:hypothetical protein
MQHNPYTNRGMIRNPDDFFGRSLELQRAFSFISNLQSVSIVGDRRIGKSSLLYALREPAIQTKYGFESTGFLFGYLDFCRFAWQQPLDFLRELARVAASQSGQQWSWQPDQPLTLQKFERLVREMTSAGFKLVFLLDEFDSILQAEAFDVEFQVYLRSLANGLDFAWVTASTARLGDISSAPDMSSPFFNIFSIIPLGTLERKEAMMLIAQPSRRQGVPLKQHTDFLLDLAGLHPFLLQIACYGLLEAYTRLSLSDYEAYEHTRQVFAQETLDHFKYAWSHLTPAARQAHIAACADPGNLSDTDKHYLLASSGYRKFVFEHRRKSVEIKPETVRNALQRLDDFEYLARSPLATLSVITSQFPSTAAIPSSLQVGRAVKQFLGNSILGMPTGAFQDDKGSLHFDILNLVYLKGRRPRQVMIDLALSERTYYRELKRAIEKLVMILRDIEMQQAN